MTEMNPLPTEETPDTIDSGPSASPRVDTLTRQAVLAAQNIAINAVLFAALGIALAIQSGGAWQAIHFIILSAQVIVTGFVCAALILRGQPKRGAWILYVSDWIAPVWASLLVVNLGYVAAAYTLVAHYFIIRYVMPKETRRTTWVITVVGVIISILAEVMNPAWRLDSSLMLTIAPILTGVLGAAFLAIIAYQAWERRQSLRIGPKLWIGFGTLVALTVILAIASFYTSNLKAAALEEVQLADEVALKADNITVQLLEARRREKDFLLRYSIEGIANAYQNYIVPNQQHTLNIRDLADEMLILAPDDLHLVDDLAGVKEQVQIYETEIRQVTQSYEERGFQDTGLEGEFRQAAATLEDSSLIAADPELQVLLLQMRRFEKDWLLRQDLEDADAVANIGEQLKRQIRALPDITTGQETELNALVDTYLLSFAALVEKDLGIAADIETLRTAAQAIEPITLAVVASEQEEANTAQLEYQAADRLSLTINIVALIFAVIAGLAVSLILTRAITGPITRLTETAVEVSAGNLGARAVVETGDEIGTLAGTFNAMTAQLQDTLEGLEQRVANRTKALATSAEVTRRLAAILDPRQLASEVVEQVQRAFEYYYAQIYLLDEAGENLVLEGGSGEAGAVMLARGHSVEKGRGLVGRAAETNTSVLVSDTSQEEGWLPNELLPETKAEAAVPISIGNQVYGVLDVQHSFVNGLTSEDVTLLESLAGQVAISLQNARSYEQSRKQAELESLVNVIGQRIQRATSIEDTLQTAIRELGTAIGATRVRASIRPASSAADSEPVSQPAAGPLVAQTIGENEEVPFNPESTPAD